MEYEDISSSLSLIKSFLALIALLWEFIKFKCDLYLLRVSLRQEDELLNFNLLSLFNLKCEEIGKDILF